MDVNSGDESPEDREYRRFLGKSASKDRKRKGATFTSPPAQKIGSNGSSQPALQGTPPLSSKAANDYIDDHEEGLSRNVFQPGAPGYIEPGSTPDKSVFDKIRLFAQRSAIAEPHNHKELFGPGGTSSKGRDAQEGRFDDKQPPKSRQVEQLLRQSRAESANVRKRGVRDVKRGANRRTRGKTIRVTPQIPPVLPLRLLPAFIRAQQHPLRMLTTHKAEAAGGSSRCIKFTTI